MRYSIVSGDPLKNFTIDEKTGVLTPRTSIDFETSPGFEEIRFFNLTVRGYDLGQPQRGSDVPVVIYILDENDFSPEFDQLEYNTRIPEDTPGGASVIRVNIKENATQKVFETKF